MTEAEAEAAVRELKREWAAWSAAHPRPTPQEEARFQSFCDTIRSTSAPQQGAAHRRLAREMRWAKQYVERLRVRKDATEAFYARACVIIDALEPTVSPDGQNRIRAFLHTLTP